jgi:hypothetical protein
MLDLLKYAEANILKLPCPLELNQITLGDSRRLLQRSLDHYLPSATPSPLDQTRHLPQAF